MSRLPSAARAALQSSARFPGVFPGVNPTAAIVGNPCLDVAVILRLIRLSAQVRVCLRRLKRRCDECGELKPDTQIVCLWGPREMPARVCAGCRDQAAERRGKQSRPGWSEWQAATAAQ